MENIKRIQRLSLVMQWLCWLAIVVAPTLVIGIWVNFQDLASLIIDPGTINYQAEHIGPINLLLGCAISMIPTGILIYGLFRLKALFLLYQQAKFYTEANIKHLRAFATALFAKALITPITGALISVVITMNNPPGQRSLSIGFGSNEIAAGFIAAVFMIIASIMIEGRKIAEENAEIV